MGFRVSGRQVGPTFPNALNTGPSVPLSSLTNVPGARTSGAGWTWNSTYVQVTGTSAVLDSLNIAGWAKIEASGVTISNCVITTTDPSTYGVAIGSNNTTPYAGTTVTDCTLAGANPGSQRQLTGVKDTYGIATSVLVQRCNMYWTGGGYQANQGTFRDNYLHDFGFITGDHLEGIHVDGAPLAGQTMLIEHNTILLGLAGAGYPQTSAIIANQTFGVCSDITIAGNLVAGGNYPLECGGSSTGIRNDSSGTSATNGATLPGGDPTMACVQDGGAKVYDLGAAITCTTSGQTGAIPSGTTITGVYDGSDNLVTATNGSGTQYTLSCSPTAVTTTTGTVTFQVNPTTSNIVIANNRVSTMFFPLGGTFGPYLRYDSGGTGNQIYGNCYHDTGVAIT